MSVFRPLELLLLYVFEGCHRLTGNYGISLLLMSLVITVGTYPLYRLADIWKKKEEDIQNRMAVEVGQIKAAFTGNKRFYMLQACYRMHGYRTWYAFRSALGLLIQIPFFFAAYNVLSSYTGYAGERFLCIGDLAAPDGLLLGLNVLPLLMTAVNLASSVVYTRSLRLKENLQLLVMAAVFLVLLYDRPAALLIYWTSNNVLSLAKSLLRKKDSRGWLLPDAVERARVLFLLKLALLWACFCVQLYILKTSKYYVMRDAAAVIVLIVSIFLFIKGRFGFVRRNLPFYLFLALSLLVYKTETNLPFLRISSLVFPSITFGVVYVLALAIFKKGDFDRIGHEFREKPFLISAFLFLSALTVLCPQTVYARSPEDAGLSYMSLLLPNLAVCTAVCALLLLLVRTAGNRGRCRLNFLFIIVVLGYAFNAVLFPIDVGVLMGFNLSNSFSFVLPKLPYLLRDIGIGSLVIILAYYLRRHQGYVMLACTVVFSFNLLNLSIATWRMQGKVPANTAPIEEAGLDASVYEKHTFSKDYANVLYICCDMFNSTYIDRIRDELPGFDVMFDGFTWYEDTLSVSGWTASSLPALYGGDEFSPLRNNENSISLAEAGRLARSKLESAVKGRGLRFSSVDDIGEQYDHQYYKYYAAKKGLGGRGVSKRKLLSMLPLFNLSPYVMKAFVYDSGFWLIYGEDVSIAFHRTTALQSLSYLELLPEISSADGGTGNFLYFRTVMPHEPFGIDRDGNVIETEYPDPVHKSFMSSEAAYYSAKKCMAELARFFDWMKENGVYDNTLIVICSDHGNSCSDNGLPVSAPRTSERLWKSRANALLMIKPFGAGNGFNEDRETLKSNGDIAATIFDSLGAEHDFEYHTRDGVRWYSFMLDLLKGDSSEMPYATYRVEGSIFDPDAWTRQ